MLTLSQLGKLRPSDLEDVLEAGDTQLIRDALDV